MFLADGADGLVHAGVLYVDSGVGSEEQQLEGLRELICV